MVVSSRSSDRRRWRVWKVAPIGLCAIALAIVALRAPNTQEVSTANGARIYDEACAVCHQAGGEGMVGVYPRLAGSAFVSGDPSAVISTLLEGRGAMPSFASDLTDSEIADVISFIRSSWDNDAPPVPRELVTDAGADLEEDNAPRR